MSNNNLQPLSEIISLESVPSFLTGFLNDPTAFFDRFKFKNFHFHKQSNHGSGLYRLTLVLEEKLSVDVPGTNDMKLSLNPDGDSSSFDIELTFVRPSKRFAGALEISSFGETAEELFEILLNYLGFSEHGLFHVFLGINYGGLAGIEDFLIDYNDLTGSSLSIDYDNEDPVMDLLERMEVGMIEYILLHHIVSADLGEALDNIAELFKDYLPKIDVSDIVQLLIPKLGFTVGSIYLALEFPRKIFLPLDEDGNIIDESASIPEEEKERSKLSFNVGSISFDSEGGFYFDSENDFSFQKSLILNTGFSLELERIKLDLSRTSNIPEADADGRPADFIGAYITEGTIGFPTDWGHNEDEENESSGELFVSNLLVGTGGISGTIGMRAVDEEVEQDPETPNGLIQLKFGSDFRVGLKEFDLTFQQNAIVESNIHGFLQIPGFKDENEDPAVIDIDLHIGQDGEFSLVASAIPEIKKIRIPGAFDFDIESAFIGREAGDDGRFYLGISGELDITVDGGIGKFLPDKLDIKKMLIYDDGTFEFEGGKIVLPRAYEIKFGPATLSITGIHMGSHEQDGRKYKYFGFDGGVSTNPGGVDAQGKGLKFYYTVDGDPFKWFIRLESLTIDIILPSGTDPEQAAVIIHGFLSISEPRITSSTPPEMAEIMKNSQEYSGGVSVRLPKFKGLEASAAMRMNPKIPAFIVDLGIEMKTPILLGATGLGIYGFRALLGKNYVAEKTAAGIPADGEWWQYYKAKIDPDYKEGIQVSKFNNKNGFSLGAGVSLATASDSGKMFSSKLFFMLSLPDVFLFQGQAQFLKERIGLDANPDPPFFAIIAITKQSIEAGFGVNYKLRDDGKLVTVDGVVEMGFFWGSSSAWYINVGRETPEDRRIQARILDILNMYFYLMMSNGGLRLGAGVKFEWAKKFGPLSAELKAYIDTFGKISKRPRQIGGAIKMGGKVGIKVCGFGFSVSGGATLAAEASKPHLITGEFEVCVTVLKKERCARFEFTWNFDNTLDDTQVPLLVGTSGESNTIDTADAGRVAGMTHMVTNERFPVAYTFPSTDATSAIPAPNSWIVNTTNDDYRVPIDSFLDIDFKKGMNVSSSGSNQLGKIGGQSTPAQFVEYVPPIRGKSDRVRHEYYLEDVEIFYWDELEGPSGAWMPYNFYNAMLPAFDETSESMEVAFDSAALAAAKWGYWQQQAPGVNNKLRILATNPLSYTAGSGDAYTIEDLGVNGNTIFCPGDPIPETCISFDESDVTTIFSAGTLRNYKQILFRTVSQDGIVAAVPFDTFDQGLFISSGDQLEMYYPEPMWSVRLRLNTSTSNVTVKLYRRIQVDTDINNLPVFDYELFDTIVKTDFDEAIYIEEPAYGIDMVSITPGTCGSTNTVMSSPAPNATEIAADVKLFLEDLLANHHLTSTSVELYDQYADAYSDFFGSSIYPTNPEGDMQVMLTQQFIGPMSLAFKITDTRGYNCNYSFEPLSIPQPDIFAFSQITGVKAVTPYTADDALGNNNNLLVDFDFAVNGSTYTARFILTTCHTISVGYNSCSAALYKMCYLSYANYLMNSTVPTELEQEGENSAMLEAISGTLQPVWRPNTAFAVKIKTNDKLFIEGATTPFKQYRNRTAFGFRTAGPVGHFHNYPTSGTDATNRDDYEVLDAAGKGDQFRLKSLKSYVDYTKSYPNADGNLSNAKPLFYTDAKLRLFYLYNHVYYFYSDWVDFDNTSSPNIANSSLEIRVLDPATTVDAEQEPTSSFEANGISHASGLGMPPSHIHSINSDIAVLNNILVNGDSCAPEEPHTPIDISSYRAMNLKPLKLYTAQFVAKYNPRIGGVLSEDGFESLVHSYVFQTSRYSNFEEQVNSYVLKRDPEDDEVILKSAVYALESPVNPDLSLATHALRDQLIASEEGLRNQYADRFDRLVNGVFALDAKTLNTAVTTEFNAVKADGKILGILIRNPEPFNNPRIPIANPETPSITEMETLAVSMDIGSGYGETDEFYVIHSKDRSQMFVTLRNYSFDLPEDAKYAFKFSYKEFNGVDYDTTDVLVENIQFNNNI